MRAARDSLLDSALTALGDRPWSAVRMVDVAVAAGVSRQTLYNEFGSKEGLGLALSRREVDGFLAGVERALAGAGRPGADPGDRFAAAASWTLATAGGNPLVRSALTGVPADLPGGPAGAGCPGPVRLVELVRDRAVGALERACPGLGPERTGAACEAAVRLTLSHVVAPAGSPDESGAQVVRLVRALLARGR